MQYYDQPYFKHFPKTTKRGYGVEIVIPTTTDLAELQNSLIADNCKVVEKLILQPWGLQDFRVEDPFGYYIRITTPHDILDSNNSVK